MPKSKYDMANTAIRIFLQEVGKFYDEARGLKPFVPHVGQLAELLGFFSSKCCYCGDVITNHESFAVHCPLALLDSAFYPVLVHRLAASLHASSPHSVALVQLRFASFAVINLRRDLHPQECARAGRT